MTQTENAAKLFGKPSILTEDAEDFLAAVIASSDDAIVSKDLNGIITSWNEGAQRIFGYEAGEIVGQSVLRLIPEELHREEDDILRKLRAGERVEHFETTRVRKNGERFPISVTISPIKNNRGVVIGASKIGRDISDRRRADESRFRLAAIVESADDAIICHDLEGMINTWNGGASRLFGYEEDEILGQSIARLTPDHLRPGEDAMLLHKLRAGEATEHYETVRVGKGGEIREVSVTVSPLRNGQGEVIGASMIARDVSDRKKVERLAFEAEKISTAGRMAAALAHEINNPLGNILNLIFLARRPGRSPDDIQNDLATAEHEIERVSHIARQTLGYYRDQGAPAEVRLQDLMETVLSVHRHRLLAHRIVTNASYANSKKIGVRPGEIIQVFSNIVSNAIDAMPQGGRLSVSTRPVREGRGSVQVGVQVIVADTGHGIQRENLSKVFEPFFTTKGSHGTGIGLWVAQQLVERRRGRISLLSSTGPGQTGTAVTIDLPFSGT